MVIDIDCHVIPGIDDGANDISTALEMCRIAQADSTHGIIATPHYIHGVIKNNSDIINAKVVELNRYVKENNIDVELYPGCEVFIFPELPQLVREGYIGTLNNSRYVLIELPMNSIPEYTNNVIYQLRLDEFIPIIAHPERNAVIYKNPDKLCDLISRGALSQVNATSLSGLFGKSMRDKAIELLRHKMVHFIASDAHDAKDRLPKLSSAIDVIEKEIGPEALLKVIKNGEAIFENQPIFSEDPINISKNYNIRFLPNFKKIVSRLL